MDQTILVPKYRKHRKPEKVRKPSRPLDGINHRLLREQAAAASVVPDDNAPPTRDEMVAQATLLGIQVDKRWSDKTLLAKIDAAMEKS